MDTHKYARTALLLNYSDIVSNPKNQQNFQFKVYAHHKSK